MSEVKIICRRIDDGDHTWRQVIALELDGHRFDNVPEGASIDVHAHAGAGPLQVTLTLFADTVDYVDDNPTPDVLRENYERAREALGITGKEAPIHTPQEARRFA